jgi:gamma-glutamyltranspeptidase/glutathione hydrolase
MRSPLRFLAALCFALTQLISYGSTPVTVPLVTARHGMVVAAHPQAAAAGLAVLKAGGNAIDAAIATSLAVGVAEPYGSGLGGKLVLLYYEAKSGRTFVVDAMDACGSAVDIEAYRKLPDDAHSYGYGSVCVPGLAAGLWTAHQKWGTKKWSDDVAPAIALARDGFEVLPKSRDFFEEQIKKLRRGDAELARLYLPQDALPAIGSRLKNEDLARTMEQLAAHGRDGFYRGPVAEALVAASQKGGGLLTLKDLENYDARMVEPVGIDFRGYHLLAAPPPATGPAIFLTIMKALEPEDFSGGPLRTAANLDKLGRVWRVVAPLVSRGIADVESARFNFEKLVAPDSIKAIREKAFPPVAKAALNGVSAPAAKAAFVRNEEPLYYEDPAAATTHWLVADAAGNIVCATQSLSLHFGAGVVPPGTGVVMNDSMSNFAYYDTKSLNFIAAGKRPRSTIAPTLVMRGGKPVFALGIPGAARIPTAMLQVLLDRLTLDRPLAEAIGDTRVHFSAPLKKDAFESFEAEQSLPEAVAAEMSLRGWRVDLPEVAGRGRHFGGINAIEFNADGSMTGIADPRRTNLAVGY